MENAGNVTCYGDVCMEDSFCDHLSKFCFQCVLWLQTCFTDSHIPRCTRVCKEHINRHVTTSFTTVAPLMDLKSDNSVPWLQILSVLAVCLISAILITVCLFRKFIERGNNQPTTVLVNKMYRLSNIILRRKKNVDQTYVKQMEPLRCRQNPGVLGRRQGDMLPGSLCFESLLNETETMSSQNVTPPAGVPLNLMQQTTSMTSSENPPFLPTSSENTTHGPTARIQSPNTNSTTKDVRDFYQIEKPVKEVGDNGRSVKVDGHVLKPRETV
ncbi:uncharacterized protein LOC117337527 [Pecten maximus]|uniref:uncharacterized protein LOC117337527 n=1 Tax=Pecten maximus TaxID=6579 RepID=UPI001457F849|nr:uncharacterized protein LOC117337527 [Pecten maximus]